MNERKMTDDSAEEMLARNAPPVQNLCEVHGAPNCPTCRPIPAHLANSGELIDGIDLDDWR